MNVYALEKETLNHNILILIGLEFVFEWGV